MTRRYPYPGGSVRVLPDQGGWIAVDGSEHLTRAPVSYRYACIRACQRVRERGGVPPGRGRSTTDEQAIRADERRRAAEWIAEHCGADAAQEYILSA